MKLVKNSCWALLLGGSLMIGHSAMATSLLPQQNKKEIKEKSLKEQQRLEFDYAFSEAVKSRMLGQLDKAISWYAACLKIDPNSAAVRYELANIYIGQDDYNSALELARGAVARQPLNIWYQVQLAQIFQKKGMIEQACGVYDKLIDYFPGRDDFFYIQAALYASIEKRDQAIKVYNRLEKKIGVTEAVSLSKQRLYSAMGKKKEAYQELNKLIKAFPMRADFYGLLADMYLSDNQEEKAFKQYQKILKVDPDNGLVHFYLSDYYRKKSDLDRSFQELEIAFASQGVEVEHKIQYIISSLMSKEKKPLSDDQVKILLDKLTDIYPNNARVHALYADFLRKSKKNEQARIHLRKVVENEKGNYVVWEELLLIDNELLDFESMYAESEEAIQYFPQQPLLYMFNGVASLQLNKQKQAIKSLKAGLDFVGENLPLKVQFLSYLGEAHYQLGNKEEAYKAFDEVLLFDPNNVMVLNNYSYYLSLVGKHLDKAEQMSSRCVELEGDNFTYLDTYAWVLYCRGRYSEAKFMMERSLESGGGESAVIVEHYGDILYKLGDIEKAMEQWKKAKGLGGDSKDLGEKVKTGKIPEEVKADEEKK